MSGINKDVFMLCDSITESELPNLNGYWRANTKFDGERVMGICKGGHTILYNRRGTINSVCFPEVIKELKKIGRDFIIDGEIIATNGEFTDLQRRALTKDKVKIAELMKIIPVKFMIFDILQLDKIDLRDKPLSERVEILKTLFSNLSTFSTCLGLCEYGEINTLLNNAKEKELEGIIIKNMNSTYESKRSKSWLKLKLFKEGELRVTKYTLNPKGIRAENDEGIAVQIAGHNGDKVRKILDKQGYCDILIQYLEKTKEDKFRFISFRGFKNGIIQDG